MKKFFITYGFGYAGCEGSGVITAENIDEATDTARHEAISNAEAFGYYQDEAYFGDLDQVGRPADEDDEDEAYLETGTLDYEAVIYVPETHDCLL
jgi:hypothetical protein